MNGGVDEGNGKEEELLLLPAEAVVNGASFSCHLHNMESGKKRGAVHPLKWTRNMSPLIMPLSELQIVSTAKSRSCHRWLLPDLKK